VGVQIDFQRRGAAHDPDSLAAACMVLPATRKRKESGYSGWRSPP
jgi:hypothetical protein